MPIPLMDPSRFADAFAPMAGHRIMVVHTQGNHGDHMIMRGADVLFRHFGCQVMGRALVQDHAVVPMDVAFVVLGGGGYFYPCDRNNLARWVSTASQSNVPVVVLPRSWGAAVIISSCHHLLAGAVKHARDRASQAAMPGSVLAPDLALALDVVDHGPAQAGPAIYLREDGEQTIRSERSMGDPVRLTATLDDYMALAARHSHVITNRLHFAIAAMLAKRAVTLMPSARGKSLAVHETWLRDLGCGWSETLPDLPMMTE